MEHDCKENSMQNTTFLKWIRQIIDGDGAITFSIIALMAFGTLMVLSTEVGETSTTAMVMVYNVIKQIIYWVLGFGLILFGAKFFTFRRFSKVYWVIGIGLSFAMLLPFAFEASGGSHAWIRLPGGFTIQPAEFLKIFIILSVAYSIYQTKKKKKLEKNPTKMFASSRKFIVIFIIELLAQKDLGTMSILIVTYLVCLLVPDYPSMKRRQRKIVVYGFLLFLAALIFFGFTDIGTQILAKIPFLSHVATRIQNMKNPFLDIYNEGYQPANSLYGIGSSNFFGRGIGNSMRKFGYLTQAENDYILAVIIEECGIFGLVIIVGFYAVIISRLFHYAFKTNELTYKVILVGIAIYISMHFILNVGGVACLIPFTGVPLLFISNGGSSLFAVCLSIGIAQSCIRRIRKKEMI